MLIFIPFNHQLFMHQFFSALLSLVAAPLNWIVVLIVLAIVLKQRSWRKRAFFAGIVIFILFGNPALQNLVARNYIPAPVPMNNLGHYSSAILPGGFASPFQNNATGFFNSSADRFIQAVKLYKTGKVSHIIVSGGNGKIDVPVFREAAWVESQMIAFGVPDSVVYVEDHAENTVDNAINSKKIIDSLKLPPPYLLVTTAFYLPRQKLVFERAGLDVVAFPCNYTSGIAGFSASHLLPNLHTLMGWNALMKEVLGTMYYRLLS